MGNNASALVPQGNRASPSWRDHIEVHPACEQFPPMTPDELRALAEDIKANGLQTPITVMVDRADINGKWSYKLLDGRNRLDAIALGGFNFTAPSRSRGRVHRRRNGMDCGLDFNLGLPDRAEAAINYISTPDNPYAFIVSANVRRRHLTTEQKRDLIAALLKAAPNKSDRQIAKTVKADNKTVAKVRREQEGREEIPHVEARIDTKGRKQPSAKKPATKQVSEPKPDIGPTSSGEVERKLARLEKLETENRRLERENIRLKSQNEELRAEMKRIINQFRPELLAQIESAPPTDDLDDIVEVIACADNNAIAVNLD